MLRFSLIIKPKMSIRNEMEDIRVPATKLKGQFSLTFFYETNLRYKICL
jgi:hypothetical protein